MYSLLSEIFKEDEKTENLVAESENSQGFFTGLIQEGNNMKEITIKTKYGIIAVNEYDVNDGCECIEISIDPVCKLHRKFVVKCIGAGIPGIIGPDVNFNVGDTVRKIVEVQEKIRRWLGKNPRKT